MSLVTTALTVEQARDLTEEVKADAAALWAKLLTLYQGEAHTALGYSSWSDYCCEEFDFGKRTAYRMLDAARVVDSVSHGSLEPPASERVAREMAPVLKHEGTVAVQEVWDEAVEQHGPSPTAAEVRDVIQNREESLLETTTPPSRRDQLRANAHKRRIVETVSYLRGLATGLGTLDVQRAVTAMEPGEAVEWAKELDRAITQLRSLRRDLETHA